MDNRVKDRRKELRMSQTELSKESGISRTTLNKIESGRQTSIKTSTIVKIAKALKTQPDALFYF